MSLISEEVIDDFLLWAEEHEDKGIFPTISGMETSYYIDRDTEKTYIMEYWFENMMSILRALEEYAGLKSESYILKRMTIELCQNRYVSKEYGGIDRQFIERGQEMQGMLPEFRYEF